MSLSVNHSVIKNVDGLIKFKRFKEGGRRHFHIGIWIDGSEQELSEINFVEYELHSSFKNRIRTSQNRKNNFSVTIWTWGLFEIKVKCYKYDKSVVELTHMLSYSLPREEGNYIEV